MRRLKKCKATLEGAKDINVSNFFFGFVLFLVY